MKKILLSFLSVLLVSSCVTPTMVRPRASQQVVSQERQRQYEMAVQNMIEQKERLYKIGYPILQSNADLCERRGFRGKSDGILLYTPRFFEPQMQSAAREVLNISDGEFIVTHVFKNSNAEEVGIQFGDKLLGVNGYYFEKGKERVAVQKLDQEYQGNRSVTMHLERNGRAIDKTLALEPVCDFSVAIENKDAINAFADGKRIVFTKGMMRFANDQELAIVFGHELAHNLNKHVDAKVQNATVGTLADILFAVGGVNTRGAFGAAGAGAYSQDFEREADYVGLYLTARAGHDIAGAGNFWRRMAVEYPSNIKGSYSASHPSPAERFANIEEITSEINRKKSARQPLTPENAF